MALWELDKVTLCQGLVSPPGKESAHMGLLHDTNEIALEVPTVCRVQSSALPPLPPPSLLWNRFLWETVCSADRVPLVGNQELKMNSQPQDCLHEGPILCLLHSF